MSSFEPTPTTWLKARSFLPDDSDKSGFSPDSAGADATLEAERLAAERTAAEKLETAHDAGRQAGLSEANLRLEPLLRALDGAAAELADQRIVYLHTQRRLLVELAIEIASSLVGRVVKTDVDSLSERVGNALSLVSEGAPVTVTLNPDDYETMTAAVDADPERFRALYGGRNLAVLADAEIAPGDAAVACGATAVDVRMDSLAKDLRRELEGTDAVPETPEETDA